ncbi:antitermination protein [Muribacter muris]|uniref:Antitermination protein n=1 Tax=Muribacter muris TaxID=67855 RepID=A0A4Y9K5Q5_9PAST|nr:antiterminator Q family protein [Muribacter muris]MBF0784461.1 antitermination protein [Muribacter muris]MBF0826243.1 antitermination protein [Muribacter muris]TFV11975.1 antitermination protein [Muribacter muris]
MAEKLLEKPRKEWIEQHLNRWGAWVFSGLDFEKRMNIIAKLMQEADPNRISVPSRPICEDEIGLVISSVVGYCIKNPSLEAYQYLEAKYVFGLSNYAIAKYQWHKDKQSKSLRTWQRKVSESLTASEWIVAKFLDLAIKNHKNADKLKKYAFNV